MIFDALFESAKIGELILLDGGMCRWHLRRDGQITIREIISIRPGAGSEILERLKKVVGAKSILARCPAHLDANAWYEKRGFHKSNTEELPSGRLIHTWVLWL